MARTETHAIKYAVLLDSEYWAESYPIFLRRNVLFKQTKLWPSHFVPLFHNVYRKEEIVRYRLAFFPALLILLLVGSFFLPSRFLPAAHAHRLFDPMDVGGVSPLVKLSRVTDHKSSSGTLQMSVGLALRHQDQLNTLLNKLYDPASPSYRQYLSVEQFTEQFGPTQEQQQAVINYLTQQGFTITGTYPNRLMIDFSGPQSLAEQVFNVKINTYEGPAGQTFFANASAPTLPAYIASYVTMISGLDDANSLYHPPSSRRTLQLLIPTPGTVLPLVKVVAAVAFLVAVRSPIFPVSLPKPTTMTDCTTQDSRVKGRR